jgi:hypothetical protein
VFAFAMDFFHFYPKKKRKKKKYASCEQIFDVFLNLLSRKGLLLPALCFHAQLFCLASLVAADMVLFHLYTLIKTPGFPFLTSVFVFLVACSTSALKLLH